MCSLTYSNRINFHSEPSLLDRLCDRTVWDQYISKKGSIVVNEREVAHYSALFKNECCVKIIEEISSGTHTFSIPEKKLISKFHAGKKRTVYTFKEEEMLALRVLTFLLYKYDYLFSDSLYSFRFGYGVRDAINKLRFTKDIEKMYGFKVDIHNYFNSIDVGILLNDIRSTFDDTRLVDLFEKLLDNRKASYKGEIVEEDKGVMAGTPVSPFLANFYLRKMDDYFLKKDCIYMRYADDIIVLADGEEKLKTLHDELVDYIKTMKLEMNPKKEQYFQPGESFNFLGFSISKNKIDISPVTVGKIKGKIKRSSRSIRRWMLKKNAPINGTVKAMIRTYNKKFFGPDDGELTWSRWFFPVITTAESLREIDNYLQDRIRYIATGRFNKKNYDTVSYETMKRCGYRSLVSEYYSSLESKKKSSR